MLRRGVALRVGVGGGYVGADRLAALGKVGEVARVVLRAVMDGRAEARLPGRVACGFAWGVFVDHGFRVSPAMFGKWDYGAMVGPGASDISPLLAGLVRLRVSAGVLTESALARVVGASQCHISAWLLGHKRLGVGLLDAVMCELGLTVAEVLSSVAAPLLVAAPRGVLLVMPGAAVRARRAAWRRRVDPARIATDFLGGRGEA